MQIGQKFRVSHSSSTRSPVRNFLFNNAFQSSSKIDRNRSSRFQYTIIQPEGSFVRRKNGKEISTPFSVNSARTRLFRPRGGSQCVKFLFRYLSRHRLLCVTRVPHFLPHTFSPSVARRARKEGERRSSTNRDEERRSRTIESTGGQARWLGRIRVPTC